MLPALQPHAALRDRRVADCVGCGDRDPSPDPTTISKRFCRRPPRLSRELQLQGHPLARRRLGGIGPELELPPRQGKPLPAGARDNEIPPRVEDAGLVADHSHLDRAIALLQGLSLQDHPGGGAVNAHLLLRARPGTTVAERRLPGEDERVRAALVVGDRQRDVVDATTRVRVRRRRSAVGEHRPITEVPVVADHCPVAVAGT